MTCCTPEAEEVTRALATAKALRLLVARTGSIAHIRPIIQSLVQALEASDDPHLQRAAADMLREAADRLRP